MKMCDMVVWLMQIIHGNTGWTTDKAFWVLQGHGFLWEKGPPFGLFHFLTFYMHKQPLLHVKEQGKKSITKPVII